MEKLLGKFLLQKLVKKDIHLDHIEHEILRKKFNDPRIHVGINCASVSCPKLWNLLLQKTI